MGRKSRLKLERRLDKQVRLGKVFKPHNRPNDTRIYLFDDKRLEANSYFIDPMTGEYVRRIFQYPGILKFHQKNICPMLRADNGSRLP